MNTFRKIVTVVTVLFAVNFAAAKDVQIKFSELPQKAQTYVRTHFSESDVASVWKDTEMLLVEDYTVVLSNGLEIDFYPNGDWKEVKSRGTEIPSKIIPSGIFQYVSQNYNGQRIKELKKKRYGYKVELSGDIDLEFSQNEKFLRIDD
ncbi:PepSY-like domain-containing protein [Capnocytophaga granulosa]|jgi:putative periplasmic protein|uniref:PepSY-like domain-containing protein n=1 Tax=Capnocytophaga granulosa TaxID=45242 RepID=UPI0023F53020|nr:PepSY-like domain-containing protein [Capnocytophaga granulosa]